MTTNGTPAEQNPAPTLNVLAQYVKDLSFENPQAPRSLMPQEKAPQINIQVNVNARGLSDTDAEVELKIEGRAGEGKDTLFSFELVYAGIFRIEHVEASNRQPVVLIECPRLLFPFARQIVAEAVRNGGFPPLMIDPIDFAGLYRQRLQETAPQVANA